MRDRVVCRNTSVAANFAYYGNGSSSNGYYYLNGFQNVITSYVTLFELTVINNWYILMEGYAATVNEWSRIYFMLFYLTIMMLLSIVVASVLDGFMFRISYKEQMSQEDGQSLSLCPDLVFLSRIAGTKVFCLYLTEKRLVEKSVTLTGAEYEQLRVVDSAERKASLSSSGKAASWLSWMRSKEPFRTLEEVGVGAGFGEEAPAEGTLSTVTFIGRRRRTKDVLLSFMFKEEISCWMEAADLEDKQQLQQQQQQELLANKVPSIRKRFGRNTTPAINDDGSSSST